MATAREVRANVRRRMAEQMADREAGALAVASAWDKVERARARAADAEREAGQTVTAVTATMPIADLAALSEVPLVELRRLTRTSKDATALSSQAAPPAAADHAHPVDADAPV